MIGHSGGTPNYSSRVVFDDNKQIGVCVLSNLNVAASTESLCNSIFDTVSGKTPAGLSNDIWTVFDKIFASVTAILLLLLVVVIVLKKKVVLITFDVIMIVLLAMILILFPIIFGAGMKAIVFTWAPWSLAGGLIILSLDIIVTTIRILMVKKYADHNKRGEGQASDDNS